MAVKPQVWNKRDHRTPIGAVYIGRPGPYGNPFSHLPNTTAQWKVATRDEAVDKYEAWLLTQPDLIAVIKEDLRDRDLVCWCVPQRCHGNIILRIANEPCPLL